MAVTNWIDHLSAKEVAGAVYPGVGSEGILVQAMQENDKLSSLARKRHGPNSHKSNITDW